MDLPSTTQKSVASDGATPLQGERLFEDTAEKVPQKSTEIIREETTVDDANDVLWVDWDGPTDPMNPKKWVMPVRLLFVTISPDE